MNYVIESVVPHGPRVKEFRIRRSDGAPLPAWQPGAHISLRFSAADGAQHEKHYSLLGDSGETGVWRIAVQREADGQGGSRCLHDEFGPGSVVEVNGPFNSFPLAPAATDGARVLLIAGGIGITPLLSMAQALSAAGRPFVLHYLARERGHLVLLDELQAIPGGELVLHLSQESGRADLEALLHAYGEGDTVYACGPSALLQGLRAAAAAQGWPGDALHAESFGRRAQDGDAPLTVELTLSGITVDVAPETSILDALIAQGAFVSYDCKRGECGSCYTRVLEGSPLHRDICLTPAMRSEGMCTCVSWAAPGSRLVLEL